MDQSLPPKRTLFDRVRDTTQTCGRLVAHPKLWGTVHLWCQRAAHEKIWTRVGVVVVSLAGAILFFVAGVILRLWLLGPISLGTFTSVVQDSVNRSLSGLRVTFGDAAIGWSTSEGRIKLMITDTSLFDQAGRRIARAGHAALDFDEFSLLTGNPVLTHFELKGIDLTAVRTLDGSLKLGLTPQPEHDDLLAAIRETLRRNAGHGSSLDHFEITESKLTYRDDPTGLMLQADKANLTFENIGGHISMKLTAGVTILNANRAPPATISATAELRDNGMPETADITVDHVRVSALAEANRAFGFLKPFQVDAHFHAAVALGPDGRLLSSDFDVSGDGMIGPPLWHGNDFRIEGASLHGHYDSATSRVVLDRISVNGTHARGQGNAELNLTWNGPLVTSFTVATQMQGIYLDVPGTFAPPLVLDRVAVNGSYDRETKTITWQHIAVNGGPLAIELNGTTQLAGERSPAIVVHGTVAALSVRDMLRFWPRGVGDGARKWIDENVPQARLGPVTIETNIAAGDLDQEILPDADLNVRLPITSGSARYMKGLTLLTNVRADATLNGDTFHLTGATATVGPMRVTNGQVVVSALHIPASPADIKAHVAGRMADLLGLINQKPLEYATRFHIDPATTAGTADLDLEFRFPMLDNLDISQVQLAVQAKVAGLVIPIDEKHRVEAGDASFAIDGKSLTSEGTASISGVPLRFKWTEDFADVARTTRIDFEGNIDDATRTRLGLTDPAWLTGPMHVTGQLYGHRFHFNGATVHADLTGATVHHPQLAFDKAAGTPASLAATLSFNGDGTTQVSDISLTGVGSAATGSMTFGSNGDLVAASLPVIRSGPNTDFSLNVTATPDGGTAYRIEGRSLDLTRLLAGKPTVTTPAQEDTGPHRPFSLSARLGQVVLRDGFSLHDVNLSFALAAQQRVVAFSLDATGPGKGRVTGRFANTGATRTISIDAEDGSQLVNGLTGFASLKGGTASARIMFPADGAAIGVDYSGAVTLKNITVMNQPFVARLFAAGSLDGPLRLLQGEGIALSKVDAPFVARGKMVTITGGRASGSAVGFTFEGTVDRRHDRIDVKGTLVPIYGLNSMISDVPLIGPLLTSKPGEGIIGLTYAVRGDLDKPDISVNPLSLVTPGILRRIFEFGSATPRQTQQPALPSPAPSAVPPVTPPPVPGSTQP